MPTTDERYRQYADQLHQLSQDHLLKFWDQLDEDQRSQLLDDLDLINFERCQSLIESHVRQRPQMAPVATLQPPPAFEPTPAPDQAELYARARQLGAEAIQAGRVAAFTVAGGQGTRLGFDGPKGAFRISPIRNAPLFQLFAENILGAERRWGRRPRWYIMTSLTNHDETVTFFEQNAYFGLTPEDVMFFRQGQMPAFHPDGRIALAEKHRVALGPDGHGGSLRALADSGALHDMQQRGIDLISYFQVDNPLSQVFDPLFIGLHLDTGSEMSSKAVRKAYDEERVGVLAKADGQLTVVEYSDLPPELASAKDEAGNRRFDAGNIALHLLNREFVERITAPGAAVQLPWHRAEKKIRVIDETGKSALPDQPNVVKLELFVFDAIPLAQSPLVLFTERAEEFSPVKNADGLDSPTTAKRDMIRRSANWLETAGVTVPRDANGEPTLPIEISPTFALDAQDLRQRLPAMPTITPPEPLLLADNV